MQNEGKKMVNWLQIRMIRNVQKLYQITWAG